MKIIKFRRWADGKMDYSPETYTGWLNDNFIHDGYDEGKEPVDMQLTGLLDINGKQIWEGDIMKVLDRDWGDMERDTKYCEVFYNAPSFELRYYHHPLKREFGRDRFEVVGNIYENPELLS